MAFLIGSLLLLGVMVAATFGPAVVVQVGWKPMRSRKLVRVTHERGVATIAGRRRNNRS
jgi:hypothetical protein